MGVPPGLLIHRHDHARPGAPAARVSASLPISQGLRACAIEASSIGMAEHRLAARRSAWRVHQLHAGPSGLPRQHGRLLAGQAGLFDWPGLRTAVINIDDPARRAVHAAAELAAVPLDLWSMSLRVKHAAARLHAADIALRRPGRCVHRGGRRRAALQCPRDRPLQRAQPAGRAGHAAQPGRAAGGCRAGLRGCSPCRAAWSAGAPARPAAGGGGLRPHARRAGQGPAALRPLAQQRGGSCGACSAAAATAMPPSAR
jgi:hypothetical protein